MDRSQSSDAALAPAASFLAGWSGWSPLFEPDTDLPALERMALALATHAQAGAAARAWLVLWDARTGLLEGWREAASGGDLPLREALTAAQRAVSREGTSEPIHAWAELPERLEGVLAEAWRAQGVAVGSGADQPGAPWSAAPQLAAIALRRGARAYGMLVCAWDAARPRAVRREALDALRGALDAALHAQAAAAEVRRRARLSAALAEFAHGCVAPVNVAEALHLAARLGCEAIGARGAAIYRADSRGTMRVEVAHGAPVLRDSCARAFLSTAQQASDAGQALAGQRGDEATLVPPGVASELSAWAVAPVVAYGRRLGALLVYDGADRHPAAPAWEPCELEYFATLADHMALLLEHARLGEESRRSERTRADQAVRLRELDRLAALGEMAARVAQESRNPLASIAAFVKRAHRELGEDDARREYLEIVLRESERLEAMFAEQREYAQLQRPNLEMQNLNAVVQEALQRFSETLVRRRVRLLKRLAPDLPPLLLDAPRIRRVVENVVAFALESVPLGGRIRVDSRRASDHVVVEIAHDGARHAGDLLEQLFVPFSAGSATTPGAAVGLGVAQQIVREHGGEVRLRSDGEWSSVFAFTLPIAGNEDRRRNPDRRSVRGERRRRKGDDVGRGS
ncbi:MAG: ATP-binding protein [Candidatus Eisenbacteria bacterium]